MAIDTENEQQQLNREISNVHPRPPALSTPNQLWALPQTIKIETVYLQHFKEGIENNTKLNQGTRWNFEETK